MTSSDKIKLNKKFTERELISGISGRSSKVAQPEALLYLLDSKSKKKTQVLENVISDAKQPYKMRLLAINEIRRNPSKENTQILLKQLAAKDDRLLSKTIGVLGETGDVKVLKELQKVKVKSRSLAAKKLDFAKKLIAYKVRSSDEEMKAPSSRQLIKVEAKSAQHFQLSPLPKRRIAAAMVNAQKRLHGLQVSNHIVTHIQCGDEELILSLTKEFETITGLKSLSTKKAIPMVMLKKRGCPEEYFLSHYFFATPTRKKNQILLTGVRPSGVIIFSGMINLSDTGCQFALKSAKNIYEAGIDMDGTIDIKDGTFKTSKALSERAINRKLNPNKTPKKAVVKLP